MCYFLKADNNREKYLIRAWTAGEEKGLMDEMNKNHDKKARIIRIFCFSIAFVHLSPVKDSFTKAGVDFAVSCNFT